MRFTFALLLIFPGYIAAIPGAASIDNHLDSRTALYPKRHPHDDPTDLENLKATTSATLYYEANLAHAVVHFPAFNYPAVSLERSDLISSVSCNSAGNTMVVNFSDAKSWNTAYNDWKQHQKFIIISYVHGCGQGMGKGARDFHLVSAVRPVPSRNEIVCTISTVKLEQAAHPGHNISFHVSKYSTRAPRIKTLVGRQYDAFPDPQDTSNGKEAADEIVNTIAPFLEKFFKGVPPFVLGFLKKVYAGKAAGRAFIEQIADTVGPYHGNFRFDTSSVLKLGKSPFGPAYTIISPKLSVGKAGNPTGSQNIEFDLGGSMSSNKQLESSRINVTGDLTAVLGIGAQFEGEVAFKCEQAILKIPIPTPITVFIPGILEVGPAVEVAVGISVKTSGNGKLLASTTCRWSKMSYTLDLVQPFAGSLDEGSWTPICTPNESSLELNVIVTLAPYIKFSLAFNLKALDSLTTALGLSASLAAQLSLDIINSISTQPDRECGLDAGAIKYIVELAFALSIEAKISDFADPKYELFKFPLLRLFDNCKGPEPTRRALLQIGSGLAARQDQVFPTVDIAGDGGSPPVTDPPPFDTNNGNYQDIPLGGDSFPLATDTGFTSLGPSPPFDTNHGNYQDIPLGGDSFPSAADTGFTNFGPSPTDGDVVDMPLGLPRLPKPPPPTPPAAEDKRTQILWPEKSLALSISAKGKVSFTAPDDSAPWLIVNGLVYLSADATNRQALYASKPLSSTGTGKAFMRDLKQVESDTRGALTFAPAEDFLLVVNGGDGTPTEAYFPVACKIRSSWELFMVADDKSIPKLKKTQKAKECVFCKLRLAEG